MVTSPSLDTSVLSVLCSVSREKLRSLREPGREEEEGGRRYHN
jgi:hypothetical protein